MVTFLSVLDCCPLFGLKCLDLQARQSKLNAFIHNAEMQNASLHLSGAEQFCLNPPADLDKPQVILYYATIDVDDDLFSGW